MKLYYIPTTRAVRPRWLLEELGITYELVNVDMKMTQEPEYEELHPHRKVPVLVDSGVTIFESTAICTYLADKYLEKGLAPAPSQQARAYYYQWLFYASVTLEPPVEHFMFAVLPNLPEKILPAQLHSCITTTESLHWFNRVAEPLRNVLLNNDYLVENQFTAADIVVGGVLLWALKLQMLNSDDILYKYVNNLMQRPAYLLADEGFYRKITL
jgi:glutathione S-transferase